MMWWYGPGMSGWGYALMTIGTVPFWALIILAAVALVRYLRAGGERAPQLRQHSTLEELLAKRFAPRRDRRAEVPPAPGHAAGQLRRAGQAVKPGRTPCGASSS